MEVQLHSCPTPLLGEIIQALGGIRPASRILDCSRAQVSDWLQSGKVHGLHHALALADNLHLVRPEPTLQDVIQFLLAVRRTEWKRQPGQAGAQVEQAQAEA